MPAPRPWTVLPHGPVERLEENLWAVSAALPRGGVNRRMAVIRLSDGALVFHNGIPLEERAMAQRASFGRPAFLVVPNRFHRLDVHAFRERHPGMKVLRRVAVGLRGGGRRADAPLTPAPGTPSRGGPRGGPAAPPR